jgi:hypothetical protein
MDHRKYAELYGGIIPEARSASEADIATTQSRAKRPSKRTRRKSPKSPESEEMAQKGKRGRPRVDTQDESAVEVRQSTNRSPPNLTYSSVAGPKSDSHSGLTGNEKRPPSLHWRSVLPNCSKLSVK